MDVVGFRSYGVLGFSCSTSFSLSKHCYLAEVRVQPSPYAFKKAVSPFSNSKMIKSKGDSKGVQTSRRNEDKRSKSFKGEKIESPHHEEIMDLLKRIRISISMGNIQNKDKPSPEYDRDIIGEPKKQVKAGNISNNAKPKELSEKIGNEEGAEENPHASGFKLTRLPSNFTKKSPIPSLSAPRSNITGETNDGSSEISLETTVQSESESLEEMKLAELKELAKSRGIKSYSKLKKSELIKVLGS
ncbi:hypothetical protein PIB30_048925 [Stylosanthes scabra]|uniref:Rho termination factor-like N-terminal domain-containing protein n=1 Tax=Stylosanthes scabra TaxID=79078 RepID=A0ABU6WKK0_9FABA|nr:hypothetical protein [Stylosanthes scabra]